MILAGKQIAEWLAAYQLVGHGFESGFEQMRGILQN